MAKIDRRCPYRVIKEEGKPDEYGKCYAEGCPYFVEEHWDINKCKTIPAICRKVEMELYVMGKITNPTRPRRIDDYTAESYRSYYDGGRI